MAEIWLCKADKGQPRGVYASCAMPLERCRGLIGLEPGHWVCDLEGEPLAGQTGRPQADADAGRLVVVQVAEREAVGLWKAGFYVAPAGPDAAASIVAKPGASAA